MKQKDIVEGGVYFTRVSGELLQVKVVQTIGRTSYSGRHTTRFLVQRVDNGRMLTKYRSASALHRTKYPEHEMAEAAKASAVKTRPTNDAPEDHPEISVAAQEAFRALWDAPPRRANRELCERWNNFVRENSTKTRLAELRKDAGFLKAYYPVISAETVSDKRAALRRFFLYVDNRVEKSA